MPGRQRIKPRRRRKIYLLEHRLAQVPEMTQKALGEALHPPVADMTVHRWETGKNLMSSDVMAAVAEVLHIEPEDLYHPPEPETPNRLLRGQPERVQNAAIRMIKGLRE